MEWWSGGVVEWWSGGVVEWWSGLSGRGGLPTLPRRSKLREAMSDKPGTRARSGGRGGRGWLSAFVNNGRSLTTRECSAYAETGPHGGGLFRDFF